MISRIPLVAALLIVACIGTARAVAQRVESPLLVLRAHQTPLSDLAFTPDGRRLISTADDGLIKIWDTATGRLIRTLNARHRFPTAHHLTADGRYLFSAGFGEQIKMWDLQAGALLRTFNAGSIVGLTRDGSRLWGRQPMGEERVTLFDVADGSQKASIEGSEAELSADGTLVALVQKDSRVEVRDAFTGEIKRTFELPENTFKSTRLALLPGKAHAVIASVTADAVVIQLRDMSNGQVVWRVDEPRSPDDRRREQSESRHLPTLVASPEGDLVVGYKFAVGGTSNEPKEARAWDTATGKAVTLLRIGGDRSQTGMGPVLFLPGGLIAIGTSDDKNGKVVLVRRPSFAVDRELAQPGWINALAATPDGSLIASGNPEGTIRVWRVGPGGPALTASAVAAELPSVDGIVGFALSPDGRRLAAAIGDDLEQAEVVVLDTSTGAPVSRVRVSGWSGHGMAWNSTTLSSDGLRVARGGGFGDRGEVRVFDAATGRSVARISGRGAAFSSVAFSPEGDVIVTGIGILAGDVRVWDARSGQLRRTLSRTAYGDIGADGSALAFSHDGTVLAVGTGGGVKLFDVRTWKQQQVLGGIEGYVGGIAFSPDDRAIAAVGFDPFKPSRVPGVVWTRGSRDAPRKLADGEGRGVAFSSDGSRLALISADGGIQLWSTATWETAPPFGKEDQPMGPLVFSPNGLLWSSNEEGALLAWNPNTQQAVARLVVFHIGDGGSRQPGWIAIARDGSYAGSESAPRFISMLQGGETAPSQDEIRQRRKPDAVRAVLAGPRGQP